MNTYHLVHKHLIIIKFNDFKNNSKKIELATYVFQKDYAYRAFQEFNILIGLNLIN